MNEPEDQGDREDRESRDDLIARMFALLTAKFEDAAGIAAQCQARQSPEPLRDGAAKLQELASEAVTVVAAVSMLLRETGTGASSAYDE